MKKTKKLIIVGDSSFAEIAYEYFTHDSLYEVVAFSVEKNFLHKPMLFDLPVTEFEDLDKTFSPYDHEVFVAIPFAQLNRLRTRLYLAAKNKGYSLASYISSHAFIWPNVTLGEHCFIFEHNVIQPFVKIGDNVILWSGNHIGHHSVIKQNCFISSHVVISGHCEIGENCFIGVNSTLADQVILGDDSLLGAASLILKSTENTMLYKTHATQNTPLNLDRFLKRPIKED